MPLLYGTSSSPERIRSVEFLPPLAEDEDDEPAAEPVRKEPFSVGAAFGISLFALFILGLILVPSADLRLLWDIVTAAARSLVERRVSY
jgi:hypothetical protein